MIVSYAIYDCCVAHQVPPKFVCVDRDALYGKFVESKS